MADDPIREFHPHAAGMRSFLESVPNILNALRVAYEAGYEAALIKALRYCDELGREPPWVKAAKYEMQERYVSGHPPNKAIAGNKISTLQSQFAMWFAVEEYLAELPKPNQEAAYAHVAENLKSDLVTAQGGQTAKKAHLDVRTALSDPELASKYFVQTLPVRPKTDGGKLDKK